MQRIVTPGRMREMERAYIETGAVTGLELMERAAEAVARTLLDMTAGGALFLCGPGNNGGDGYAAARLFAQAGRPAWIWTIDHPETLRGDARANMLRCQELSIPIRRLFDLETPPGRGAAPEGCGAVVDALFGTGLSRPLEGLYADAVRWMNAGGLPVLAVDMPSGTPGLMVRAHVTVAFHRMKPCHLLPAGRVNAGRVIVADIGIPHEDSSGDFLLLAPEDIPRLLPPRPLAAHKGDCGHVLALAGSLGMAGAAALCANAALRGGAGLATVACPREVLPTVQALAPCATAVPRESLGDALAGKTAIAAGPGLGASPAAGRLLAMLARATLPQVWDADALNWLAKHPMELGERFVLTPHPGEAARLLGSTARDVAEDPVAAAERLGERYGATVLVKGATTVIAGRGQRALNITGTPGMATGGSGDVLTGLAAALLAQGLSPFDAAALGALLHGMAGEEAARLRGVRSMTAQDLLEALRID